MAPKITAALAATGLLAPAWLPTLQNVSTIAGALVPVASLVWLITQTVLAIRNYRRSARARNDDAPN